MMDIEPGTSSEADKSDTEASCTERKYKGGGTTCCIPTCSSNTKRNPDLSFCWSPADKKLRKMWLHWIGQANFLPNNQSDFAPSILWVARGHVFTTFQL